MKLKSKVDKVYVPKNTIERVVNINSWFWNENKRESEARKNVKINSCK